MPTHNPGKECQASACHRTAEPGKHYCSKHANRPKRPETRTSPASRGYDRPWRALRLSVIARDGGRCQQCGVFCGESGHVDHKTPKRAGGSDDPENLWLLCHSCHSQKTARGL